jgi:site-specific recombinase XerD
LDLTIEGHSTLSQEPSMTGKTISPLRQRMIEDMTVRSFNLHTQNDYTRAIKKLTVFLNRSPDAASAEDLRHFQIHLRQFGVTALTVNSMISALRLFFRGKSTSTR